jgi:hypothetical protein
MVALSGKLTAERIRQKHHVEARDESAVAATHRASFITENHAS